MRSTPLVLGVLSMVFGGVQAAWTAVSLVTQPFTKGMMSGYGAMFSSFPRRAGEPDPKVMFARMARMFDEIQPYLLAIHLPMLVLSLTLAFTGFQLYKRQPRARPLAIGWAIAALVFVPIQTYIQLAVIQPHTMAAMKLMFAGMPGGNERMMQSLGVVQSLMTVGMYLVLYVPFPVVLLILIGRASAKADLVPVPAAD